jgi:dipeptidase D
MKEFIMDDSLQNMEPKVLWKHFLEISSIPRGSGNETAAINHVERWARALGYEVIRDSAGNLVIRKAATDGMEDRAGVVIQAHIDMVCEKNEGTRHDFLKDPLRIYREGDLVRARGTTLGADNGIGVAAALAILESGDLKHGPLEIVITVDEETGLTGANEFQGGILNGKYFLNLDSEDEGILTIGCAGGLDTTVTRALHLRAADPGKAAFRLKVAGLKGGHSGIDIDRGRGNSIAILARILHGLRPTFRMDLASLDGGNKRNAIPREAFAVLAVAPEMEDDLRREIAYWERAIRNELGGFDPGLTLSLEPVDLPERVMSEEDSKALLGFILNAPNGVISMTPDMEGLVQTSCNPGVAQTVQGKVEIILLSRSSIDSSKAALAQRIEALAFLAAMECSHNGGYPGWKPEPETWLVKTMTMVFEEMYSRPMVVKALHAGLECGIIGERYPGMEMVSIGPDMNDVHTPEENVSISSVRRFWEYLIKVIETI